MAILDWNRYMNMYVGEILTLAHDLSWVAKVRFLPREIVLTTSLPFSKFSARTAMFSCDFRL